MKKLIYFIAIPVLLIALLITALEMFSVYTPSVNIHYDAPVITKKSIIINARPEKAWAIMSKVNEWATWQSDIKNPKLESTFAPGNSFTWETGGLNIRSTLHQAIPAKKIGWSGPAFGSFAIHNWTFIGLPNGATRVEVEESMEGWLVKIMTHKFQAGLETSLDKWLLALKVTAEK
jgi:hypothetical protein